MLKNETIFNSLTLKVKYIDKAFTDFAQTLYITISVISRKRNDGEINYQIFATGVHVYSSKKKKHDANNDHDRPIHVSLLPNFNKIF